MIKGILFSEELNDFFGFECPTVHDLIINMVKLDPSYMFFETEISVYQAEFIREETDYVVREKPID